MIFDKQKDRAEKKLDVTHTSLLSASPPPHLCAYSFICNNNPGQNTFFQSSVPFVTDRKLLVAFEINELCHKTIMHT